MWLEITWLWTFFAFLIIHIEQPLSSTGPAGRVNGTTIIHTQPPNPQLVYNHLFHPVDQTTGNMAFRSVRKRDDDISQYHKPNYGSGYPEHPSIKKTKLDVWSLDYLLHNPESKLANIDLKVRLCISSCAFVSPLKQSKPKREKQNISSSTPFKHSSASNQNPHLLTPVCL